MERLLGQAGDLSRPQPVEYCVVCGDKASGTVVQSCMNMWWWWWCLYVFLLMYPGAKPACVFVSSRTGARCDSHAFFAQGVTMERSVVKDAKVSSSGVWGRTWPTAAAVNRTASSTNTTAIAASSVGWGNALKWGWRLSVSLHPNPEHVENFVLKQKGGTRCVTSWTAGHWEVWGDSISPHTWYQYRSPQKLKMFEK